MLRWLIFIGLMLLIDFYAFQSIKTVTRNKWLAIAYWLLSIGVLVNFVYSLSSFQRTEGLTQRLMLAFGLLILSISPKVPALLFMFGEDVYRVFRLAFNFFSNESSSVPLQDRRDVVSKLALGLAAIPFGSVLYGMLRGKYNYQVIAHTLYFEDLPKAFDGFKLTHISDIHSGSFDNAKKIGYGVDLINEQESDVVLFTGDIVNNKAEEMDQWIPYFSKLEAPDGKYAVLGNHDYGDYTNWKTAEEKVQNFQDIKNIHPKIGFDLLLNDSVFIEKDGERLAIIGVENWGTRFKKAGDLNKASAAVAPEDFKILMTHDPSHWDAEVKAHPKNFHLTLSGHTHGMQFGIEIPGIRWSPVQYIYKQWAGVYDSFGRYINVNRGFGFLAFPGRVGIWPEISVITLKKK